MARPAPEPKYAALGWSLSVSLAIVIFGMALTEGIGAGQVFSRLFWPLGRLIFFIGVGLLVGQVIEAAGWTRSLAALAAPLFRFGRLGDHCSAAFTTAFFSGVAANGMLLEFYQENLITKKQLFLANFLNQFPAYFLHLPTTVFIVIPLTGWAGVLYFLITFAAVVFRSFIFLLYGHFQRDMTPQSGVADESSDAGDAGTAEASAPRHSSEAAPKKNIWKGVKKRLPARLINVAVYVIPIYILVFFLNAGGAFEWTQNWLARYVATTFIPMEALSLVILSFAAEFTSGFATAGALLDAGVLTAKQTVLALLLGNVIAFPIRALRHQLPRYMGVFSPKMGSQLLFMGQGFRVASILMVGACYYLLG